MTVRQQIKEREKDNRL